jgi:hypothetical protein
MAARGTRFAGGSRPSAVPRSAITEASRDADVRRRQRLPGPKGELLPTGRNAQDGAREQSPAAAVPSESRILKRMNAAVLIVLLAAPFAVLAALIAVLIVYLGNRTK